MHKINNVPKISIVTPSYNQGNYLEETINSVLSQNYRNLEYIIIDGGSSDNSLEIIKKHKKHLNYWVSEPDRGQAHALNKGFRYATGQIYGFLNSDDLYNPGVFNRIAEEYQKARNKNKFWIAFGVEDFDKNRSLGIVWPKENNYLSFWIDNKAYLHQPGVFWSKEIHNVVGGFDSDMQYAFDRKFFVSALLKGYKFKTFNDFVSTRFRKHLESKTVSVGDIENMGFAHEIDKVSAWAWEKASLDQRIRINIERRIFGDLKKSEAKLSEFFDNYEELKISEILQIIFISPIKLFDRRVLGAIKKLIKKSILFVRPKKNPALNRMISLKLK